MDKRIGQVFGLLDSEQERALLVYDVVEHMKLPKRYIASAIEYFTNNTWHEMGATIARHALHPKIASELERCADDRNQRCGWWGGIHVAINQPDYAARLSKREDNIEAAYELLREFTPSLPCLDERPARPDLSFAHKLAGLPKPF